MAKVCPSCELVYGDDDFFCAADGSPLRSTGTEQDNLVGTVIADRYRVEAIIGEGGMGRVYRARHVRVPREAAIKVLRRALIADPYAVSAFNREARNAASVGDHPNVAAVYDFGETPDGLVFLAMEFIDGETLGRLLERDPILPPARAVEIIRQTAAGLTAAHELPEPVVHRDLKPDNILLKTTRDRSDWVKIVDFGIAKAAKRETQLLTTPGLVVGTPRYMSPEQLTGGLTDVRSDIYALGLIAFQMVTGRMPFASTSREEELTIQWALQRLTLKPLTLGQVAPDMQWPPAAQEAFDHVLATRAEDRTPSANEFARSLARAFGLTTPSSIVGVIGEAPGPVARAHADSVAVATASVAPLTRGTDPTRTEGGVSDAATQAATPVTRRSSVTKGVLAGVVIAAAGGGLLWQWSHRAGATVPGPPTVTAPNESVRTTPPIQPTAVLTAPADTSARVTAAAPRTPSGDTGTPAEGSTLPDAGPAAAAATRASLDRVKSALADPDAVAAAGNGPAILRDIRRLLPRLISRADSVEATYYEVETNLMLDRPAEACRLLTRVRPAARGTVFEARIERFLGDADLDCASRR
jgi:serine/threonine-protein kinase